MDTNAVPAADGDLAFEVVPIPGKGHGCRARRDIAQGERIFAERPLVEQGPGKPTLQAAVDALSPVDRGRFFALTQNESKYGTKKSARGIFMTNAHPCHDHSPLHRGIFPTVARFNHACYPSAVYRWNAALQQLTVHATRRILAGTEICVSYSFDGLRREERQRHLRDIFGFACRCSKCTLSGDALRESDERLTALGDVDACARALCDDGTRHFLQHALQLDPATFLSRLDARFQLLLSEFPEGHMDGVECYLQLFVEVLERIASKLLRVADRADSGRDANALSKASAGALSSPGAVRDAAATYMGAAHAWALLARDASRDLKGEDSPAYGLWAAAIDEGYWRPGGALDFHVRWIDAGLARHSYCHRLVI